MAFQKPFTSQVPALGAGEVKKSILSLSADTFAADLVAGLFVRQDTSVTDKIALAKVDGSATPAIVGVATRELGTSFAAELSPDVDSSYSTYLRKGLVTVTVKAGETPASLGDVFVSNAGDADDGKATATGTDEAVSAVFIEEVQPVTGSADGVWLVELV